MKHTEDAAMLPRLQQGDLQALKHYFLLHYRPLCLKAALMLGNLKAAEQLVQDVFRELWQEEQYLYITAPVADFLYASVHTACEATATTRTGHLVI